jgi:hypothetical protein
MDGFDSPRRMDALRHRRDGVGGFGRRHDALGAGELHTGGEALRLTDRDGLEQSELVDVGDERRHAVVAKPAGMDRVGDEVVAQRVHLHERGQLRRIPEVVGVDAAGERRRRLRLHRDHPVVGLAAELLAALEVALAARGDGGRGARWRASVRTG